ncbi:MAG: hypothetical protein WAM90_09705 [Rhodanobacter sp.]
MTISQLLLAMLLIPSIATAADQRIMFSGAIVEPTCGVVVSQSASATPQRLTCVASNHGISNSIYVLTTRHLSDLESDRVLEYYDAYVKAGRSDAVAPTLLTQTYD